MSFKKCRVIAVLLAWAIGAGQVAYAASEQPKLTPTAHQPSWPPIGNAKFRSELLSLLSRSAPAATSAPELRDVTDVVLNASLAPYCDMPADLRKKIHLMTMARPRPEDVREMEETLRRECGLRVFARQEERGKIFVATYERISMRRNGKPYLSVSPGFALAVTAGAGMDPKSREVAEAARAASNALK